MITSRLILQFKDKIEINDDPRDDPLRLKRKRQSFPGDINPTNFEEALKKIQLLETSLSVSHCIFIVNSTRIFLIDIVSIIIIYFQKKNIELRTTRNDRNNLELKLKKLEDKYNIMERDYLQAKKVASKVGNSNSQQFFILVF